MFQREDPAFVRRVFLQPQARRRLARVGWHAAGHETRAAGCFAVGSQGSNGGFPRATHTVERLAETNPLKNSIFFAKEGVQPGKIAGKLRKSEKKP